MSSEAIVFICLGLRVLSGGWREWGRSNKLQWLWPHYSATPGLGMRQFLCSCQCHFYSSQSQKSCGSKLGNRQKATNSHRHHVIIKSLKPDSFLATRLCFQGVQMSFTVSSFEDKPVDLVGILTLWAHAFYFQPNGQHVNLRSHLFYSCAWFEQMWILIQSAFKVITFS